MLVKGCAEDGGEYTDKGLQAQSNGFAPHRRSTRSQECRRAGKAMRQRYNQVQIMQRHRNGGQECLVQALLKAVQPVDTALVLRRHRPSLKTNIAGVHGGTAIDGECGV